MKNYFSYYTVCVFMYGIKLLQQAEPLAPRKEQRSTFYALFPTPCARVRFVVCVIFYACANMKE